MYSKLKLFFILQLILCNSVFAGPADGWIRWCTLNSCKVMVVGMGLLYQAGQAGASIAGGGQHQSCECTRESANGTFCAAWECSTQYDCFSKNGKVVVLEGNQEVTKTLHDLRIGDRVKVGVDEDGHDVYDVVESIPHRDPQKSVKFLKISAGENSLHISHNHFIFKAKGENEVLSLDHSAQAVKASQIKVSDLIWVNSKVEKVTDIQEEEVTGIYAPITKDTGMIEVDGVAASCYSTLNYFTLQKYYFKMRSFLSGKTQITEETVCDKTVIESMFLAGFGIEK